MARSDLIALSVITLSAIVGWQATNLVFDRSETILEVVAADGHSRIPFGMVSNDPSLAREIENFVTPVTVRLRGPQFDGMLMTAGGGGLRVTIRQRKAGGWLTSSATGASLDASVRNRLVAVRETVSRDTPDPHAVFFGAFARCESYFMGHSLRREGSSSVPALLPGYMLGERRRCVDGHLMDVEWSESESHLVFSSGVR